MDIVVTEAMMRDARAVAADPGKFARMMADPLVMAACRKMCIEPEELVARPFEDFRKESGRAREVSQDVQRKRFNNFEARRIWKLAAVLNDRANQEALVAERAEKDAEVQRAMVRAYSAVIERETERVVRSVTNVKRLESVLTRQTSELKERRRLFDEKKMVTKERMQRQREAVSMQQRTARDLVAEREAEKQAMIAEQREREEQARWQREAMSRDKAERLRLFEESKRAEHAEFLAAQKREEDRRLEVFERVAGQDTMFREHMSAKLAKKSDKFSAVREMRDAAIEQNREDRRLMFAAKLENAERMRRVKQQRRREMLEAMSYTDARLQHAKAVAAAALKEAADKKAADVVQFAHLRKRLDADRPGPPGPSDYFEELPGPTLPVGGKWTATTLKSALDVEVERKAAVPGPGHYDTPVTAIRTDKGVLWNLSAFPSKTALQLEVDRAARVPGPGEYNTRPRPVSRGVVFPEGKVVSYIDAEAKRASELPAPGEFERERVPPTPQRLKALHKDMAALAQKVGAGPLPKPPVLNGKLAVKLSPR